MQYAFLLTNRGELFSDAFLTIHDKAAFRASVERALNSFFRSPHS